MVTVIQSDLNMESTNLLTNAITYLDRVSTLPEIKEPTLKSFISLKTKLMSLKLNNQVNVNPSSLYCQRCFLSLRDGPTKYKVKPKNKNHRFAKKMLNKRNNGIPLTKYQEEYLQRNRSFNGNYLEVTCGFCKNKTIKNIPAPPNLQSDSRKRQKDLSIIKKQRKKKGDKLCGLNEEAVISVESKKKRRKGKKSGVEDCSIICLDTPKKKPKLCNNNNNDESVILLENTSIIEQVGQVEQKNEENNPPSNNNSIIICTDLIESDKPQNNKPKSNKSHRTQRAEESFIDQRNYWSPEFEPSNQKFKFTKKKRPRQALDLSTPVESTPKSNSAIKKQKTSNLKLSKLLNEGANKKKSSSNLLQFLESL
ncbi:unnamed protein product [Phyllotreta striolata]|uniref:Uncharacterized protein n=1 Tax=Phyllotreta striolata TaxID=444603 RepID=A0A9N9THI4_PHYSR|nr:unnamed protein product [Phyllotreta striolata]